MVWEHAMMGCKRGDSLDDSCCSVGHCHCHFVIVVL